jgi:hypothetical protein
MDIIWINSACGLVGMLEIVALHEEKGDSVLGTGEDAEV